MFLSFALYEKLNSNGKIESFHIHPGQFDSHMTTDRFLDVSRTNGIEELDLGPLRFYVGEHGLKIKRTVSQLSCNAFKSNKNEVSFRLRHSGLPIYPQTTGFYGLLLPKDYIGMVECNVKCEQIWLEDINQLLITCELKPRDYNWEHELNISGLLKLSNDKNALIEMNKLGISPEVFRNGISELHDNSIRNFLRAVNRSLEQESISVFLSHSSTDRTIAREIATALSGRGIKVWIDEAEIRIGDSLIEKMEHGINISENIIVLLSERSVGSKWCKEELRMALSMQINNNQIKVLPAIIENCTIPGFLQDKAYADFRDNYRFDKAIEDLIDSIIS